MGRVAKAHGLRGDVIVDLSSDRVERVAPGAVLWTAAGPLVVAASQPHQHRWLVTFEGVNGRTAAEALAGGRCRPSRSTTPRPSGCTT